MSQQNGGDKTDKADKVDKTDKRPFKERFESNYIKWFNNSFVKVEEEPKVKYLTTGILEKREKQQTTGEEDPRLETSSELPGNVIYGFKNEIKSLKNFLLDQKVYEQFRSLVVVGEYGVGKTALCKTIFNDDAVKSVYAPRVWVSMHSKDSKAGENKKVSVVKRILKSLGVEDSILALIQKDAEHEHDTKVDDGKISKGDGETENDMELPALLYALHLNLRWKKYLIVIDDVRQEDNWNEILQDDEEKLKKDERWGKYLSDGFPKGSGGRVIYTTRDYDLARNLVAEEHEIHRLWPLTDTNSVWAIYEAALKENKEDDPPRNDTKCIDELMNKSRGLPLAARLMATLLPVFLDAENTENDVNSGAADSTSNPPPEENTTAQTPQN